MGRAEPFRTADQDSSALVRDRVEALGGSLEITSPVGVGTSLLAEIPIAND
jgi:signal transduction histidine kinase